MNWVFSFLFFFDAQRFRSKRRAAAALFFAALATLIACSMINPFDQAKTLQERSLPADGHMVISVEQAFNKHFCGVESGLWQAPAGSTLQPLRNLITTEQLNTIPLQHIVETRIQPLSDYCRSMHILINNENAISWIYASVFRFRPHANVLDLFRVVTVLRIGMLGFVAFSLLLFGVGFIFAFASILIGLKLDVIVSATFPLSIYPFMTSQLVVFVCLVSLIYKWLGAGRNVARLLASGAAAGVAICMVLNMRTSHGMMASVALAGCAGLIALRERNWLPLSLTVVAALTVAAMNYLLLPDATKVAYNYTYHSVSHPLVLGLANPPNAFADREGIKWDDSVGITLAHRVDPSVTYLGPTYERAMFSYYFGLWKKFPLEMTNVYALKIDRAGVGIPAWSKVNTGRRIAVALLPVAYLMQSGWLWLLCQIAVFAIGAVLFVRQGSAHWFGLSLFGALGCLLIVENGMILSSFYPSHSGSMAAWAFLTGLLVYQALVNAVTAGIKAMRSRI